MGLKQPLSWSSLPDPHTDISISILVSAPPTYPATSPPQLQLLSKYIGPYGVSSSIFGAILRTFISTNQGVEWINDTVCVFDGLEHAKEQCGKWYEERLTEKAVGEIIREEEKEGHSRKEDPSEEADLTPVPVALPPLEEASLPNGIEITVSDPITDRKSTFVGRACRITDPAQVSLKPAFRLASARKRFSGAVGSISSAL